MKDEYLSSLIGRAVQVYKGGPDSNVGVLLGVNEDYLTLQKADGEIIYYKTAHIKSIRENSQIRFNSILKVYDANNLYKADTFNELAVNFKDQTIRINGKGPESKLGKLIDVKGDFFVLLTEADGLIFYKEHHVTSLSHSIPEATNEAEVIKEEVVVESSSIVEEGVNEFTEMYNQIAADTTNDLLSNLKYSWIKINRKGPESIEGMLVESNEDYLILVVNNEIFRIATFHVENFSINLTKTEDQGSEQTKDQNSKEETSNEKTSEVQTTTGNETQSDNQFGISLNRSNARRRRNNRLKKKAKEQATTTESDKKIEGKQITEQTSTANTTSSLPINNVKRRKKHDAKAINPREEFKKKRT